MDAARQRLAQAGLVAVALLAGCGSSEHAPAAALKLALPVLPRTLDPAKAADMPSLNVAHELYAGLTRFSETGVEPDLAQSWDVEQGGLVWTFHLRKNLRWSDDRRLTAGDFHRAWLRALAPSTGATLAGPDLGIVRGARRYHATGRGSIGVEAPDDRTLRVTLQHPVPWFDQLVAHPIAAPYRPDAYSGPFRLARRFVLERNFNYWNARSVKPSRLELTTQTKGADAVLPRGLSPPGLPWIDTAGRSPKGSVQLPSFGTGLIWLVSKGTPLADVRARRLVAWAVTHVPSADQAPLISPAMPGAATVNAPHTYPVQPARPLHLTLSWAKQDRGAAKVAANLLRFGRELPILGARVDFRPVDTRDELLARAGRPGTDLVLLGWSSKVFDPYNELDLFTCGSAFNIAHWCDPSYDRLMRQAVRTLDDQARWRVERRLVAKLRSAVPAIPVYTAADHAELRPGVRGFRWSPIGFYELDGMTRS